jgi:hypothetical protein
MVAALGTKVIVGMHCYNTETRSLLEHIVATLHADIVITM